MRASIAFLAGLVATPIILVLAATGGILGSDATSDPPAWESSIGVRALNASLAKRSTGLKNPIAANDVVALKAGKDHYDHGCSGCHGDAQGPSDWGAKGFYPRAPQFFQNAVAVTPEEAFAAVHEGVRYSGMGSWKSMMTDQQIWQVANYVSHIRNLKR
jgi:mono/diheme cytochrome c family protein